MNSRSGHHIQFLPNCCQRQGGGQWAISALFATDLLSCCGAESCTYNSTDQVRCRKTVTIALVLYPVYVTARTMTAAKQMTAGRPTYKALAANIDVDLHQCELAANWQTGPQLRECFELFQDPGPEGLSHVHPRSFSLMSCALLPGDSCKVVS